jgi:hypothetical protein
MPANLPSLGALGSDPAPPPRQQITYNLPPQSDFSYMASPVMWDVFETDAGPEILPSLSLLRYTPGQSGVRQVKDINGKWAGDPTAAIAHRQRRGYVPVPKTWRVDLFNAAGEKIGEKTGYTHCVQGRRGKVHLSAFDRPYDLGGSTFIERDNAGWWVFLRRVRDELLNGGPDPQVKAALRAKLEQLGRMAGEKAHASPSARRTCDQIAEKLKAFDPPARGKKR